MGFLDSIVDTLVGGAVGFLTGGPAGAIAGAGLGSGLLSVGGDTKAITGPTAAPSATSLTSAALKPVASPAAGGGLLSTLGGILGGGAAQVAGQAIAPAARAAVLTGAAGCPTGKNQVMTIVQVLKPDGTLCSQKVLRGRPFLMNADIVTAKRVFRTIGKLSGRMPKRTVKQSKASMLTEAALDKALRDTIGDNGNGACK